MEGSQVLVEGHVQVVGRGAGDGHGNAEDSVGAELAFVLGSVQFDHGAVDVDLLEGVEALDLCCDDVVDILDGFLDALAHIAAFVAVAEFDGFVFAGGCSGGNRGAAEGSVLKNDVYFNSRVAAGIEDLARFDVFDNAHGIAPYISIGASLFCGFRVGESSRKP